MTIRQVFYQLVGKGLIENTLLKYKKLGRVLAEARKRNLIPWEWIEDRTRRPRTVNTWNDIPDFIATVKNAYNKDIWEPQAIYFESWLEKDALSGIFEEILLPYRVTLNVGRGYDGWDSIHEAVIRFEDRKLKGKEIVILYFGDFDPSGEDMVKSLKKRMAFLGCKPKIIKCALTLDDIQKHNLPSAMAKKKDTRSKKFIEQYGNLCVEIDALPINVLIDRIQFEVERHLDMDMLKKTRHVENTERMKLKKLCEENN